jgi:lipid-A-disaccharide synthase
MGFTEVVASIPRHLRLLSEIRRRFARGTDRVALLVDYPGFHQRVARAARREGIPVLYYIAPQLWAWAPQRAERLRGLVTHVASILPFEESFFRALGIPATFVGHPLLDEPSGGNERDAARRRLGIDVAAPTLALFPGSRPTEVARMWPVFREAARGLRQDLPDLQVIVAGMPGLTYAQSDDVRLYRGEPRAVLAAGDAVLCKSGTATLEAALLGRPMVIAYKTSTLTYHLARRLVTCEHIGLVNLIAQRRVAPEFIQGQATASALRAAVRPLLDREGRAAREQCAAFPEVRQRLGSPGAAERVVQLAEEIMRP